jgi:hypothetical protein
MMLWKQSGEAAFNQRLEAPLKILLQRVVATPDLHSRFLNMLSLLEHVGSRKIMLSQMRQSLDKEILKHMAEETRHAFFFKHQAERIAGHDIGDYENENTLCPAEARAYFGRLDAKITQALHGTNPRAPYLWVSFIIEIRAGWVYHYYQQALADAGLFSLKSVIAEEEKHLAEMQDSLNAMGAMNDVLFARAAHAETRLFGKLLDALLAHTAGSMEAPWQKSLTA